MVAVVGPSGVGKDSVLAGARRILADSPDVTFCRRVITRPSVAEREDHDSLSTAQFEQQLAAGRFALHWRAHDFLYGVPADTVRQVSEGKIVIVNGSRAAIPDFRSAYSRFAAIWMTAPVDVLAARLSARGSETAAQIERRLRRQPPIKPAPVDVVIENASTLDACVAQFVAVIRQLAS